MQLYIGNQNYSTWSLRAWLIFDNYNLNAEVIKLKLFTSDFYDTLAKVTPTAKVPTLVDGDVAVWDSLAILEYVNDAHLNGAAWPSSVKERAHARAISAEMHSGFFAVRNEMPMNCRAQRKLKLSEDALKDIARIDAIWSTQMEQYPEGWLFGEWSPMRCLHLWHYAQKPMASSFQKKHRSINNVCLTAHQYKNG